MKRVQKVVVRERRKRDRQNKIKRIIFSFIKLNFYGLLVLLALGFLYDYLVLSDKFMIKSIELKNGEPMSRLIEKEISYLKGFPILTTQLRRSKRHLEKKYPIIQSVKFDRIFPDHVQVYCSVRKPVALTRTGKTLKGIDSQGMEFPIPKKVQDQYGHVPVLVMTKEQSLLETIEFIQAWFPQDQSVSMNGLDLMVKKFNFDSFGEVTLTLFSGDEKHSDVEVLWGTPDLSQFEKKYRMLRDVFHDVQIKSIHAKSINLRDVPYVGSSLLASQKVVGRVMVRTEENDEWRNQD